MPDESGHPIAYTALQPGTPVQTSDGHQFATVGAVLVDEKVSVFDGIVVQTAEGTRFVDADLVGSIYTTHVRTTLSAEQAASLPLPDGSTLVDIKPSRSMGARLGPDVRSGEAVVRAGSFGLSGSRGLAEVVYVQVSETARILRTSLWPSVGPGADGCPRDEVGCAGRL